MENSNDTVKLLRECSSGILMGIEAINEVMSEVQNPELKSLLSKSRETHDMMRSKTNSMLEKMGKSEENPPAMARGMSWLKTNMKMGMSYGDSTVADLITDGCNMGIKSLSKYLNEYELADQNARKVADELIAREQELALSLRRYL